MKNKIQIRPNLILPIALLALLLISSLTSRAESYDFEPIRYETAKTTDPVTLLQKRLDTGETTLTYDPQFGYLPAILKALNVPPSSQGLVFSRTSFQLRKIGPKTPRAVYFSDDMYVGYVQGGDVLEFTSVDPELGGIFYVLDQQQKDHPKFKRLNDDCLQCHSSSRTQSVPGHMVRSVVTDSFGFPMVREGSYTSDHTSPVEERWGGWYVSGTTGRQHHMGNLFTDDENPIPPAPNSGVNVTDLSHYFDTSRYLSPHSDIVALMVLEHQTQMHNLITRAAYQTRIALYAQKENNQLFDRPPDYIDERTTRKIERAGEALLIYMLMLEEAFIKDKMVGVSTYAKEFVARGPRDKKGRSLHDLDLNKWLFEYPCSFLIYSDAFDALPIEMKDYLYRRLWEILSGKDRRDPFSMLSTTDRRAILEILLDTKEDLPDYWRTPIQWD